MADKLLFRDTDVKELKIGKSFYRNSMEESFHTIRYDFKPASVDPTKVGSVEVADKEVTLAFPLTEGFGSQTSAIFKGNKTPASKDCLLIINHVTGEITLERVSQNIRVKKTRTERNKPYQLGPSVDSGARKRSPQSLTANSPNFNRPSPTDRSPSAKSPNVHKNNLNLNKTGSSTAPGSMPMLGFGDDSKSQPAYSHSIMSDDSSSDSDSNSGSSSSSESESDSEPETSVKTHNDQGSNGRSGNEYQSTNILDDLNLSEED